MLSLYEKIKIRLIILFLLAALSFIGLFFIINYQLVSERAVKRADSRFELIQKNVGYFFKDIERSGNDSNLLIVFYVQIMPDDLVMQLHRF
ncbi:Cyclic di-GMP phosphodiesterase [Escherichia coli]